MKARTTILSLIIFAVIIFASAAANSEIIDFRKTLNDIDAGYNYTKVYTGSAPSASSLSYSIHDETFFVGGKSGSRLYYNRTRDGLGRNKIDSTFWTNIYAEERGAVFSFRFAAMNDQSFSVGVARKVAELARFREYSFMGTCNPCVKNAGADSPDVTSFPITFDYSYDPAGPWSFGAGYLTEKLEQQTANLRSIETKKFSLRAGYTWRSLQADLSIGRLNPSVAYTRTYPIGKSSYLSRYQLHDNTHLELNLAWRPRRHVKFIFTAGSYSDGLPTAGSAFSPIATISVFSYLYDGSGYSAYNTDFKYLAFGVELSLR